MDFATLLTAELKIDKLPSVYLKRLYYDTVSFSPQTLTMVRNMVGADHMVMGSDYPHLLGSIDRAVSSIEGLELERTRRDNLRRDSFEVLNNV
jgi:aminocarboxymuconate-semialdehyde decarboxylase